MKDLDLSQLGNSIATVFKRFHMTIFIVLVSAGLIAIVLMLNSTINMSTDSSDFTIQSDQADTFDQETIKQIQELQRINQDPDSTKLPSGRINPFVE